MPELSTKQIVKKPKPPKTTSSRTPKPATLLSYILDYMDAADLGKDQPIHKLIDLLERSIIDEAIGNARG